MDLLDHILDWEAFWRKRSVLEYCAGWSQASSRVLFPYDEEPLCMPLIDSHVNARRKASGQK